MRIVLYCFVFLFVLSACQTIRTAEKERPVTLPELLVAACKFGTVQTVSVTTGKQFAGCPQTQAWDVNDTILILTYSDSTMFWRVTNQEQDRGDGGNRQT